MAIQDHSKENILEEANRIIHGARNEAYGVPLDDFGKTARMWEAVFSKVLQPDARITAEMVALAMICVKISRLVNTPNHRDSIVDIAGYAGTYEMVTDERQRREQEAAMKVPSSLKKAIDEYEAEGGAIFHGTQNLENVTITGSYMSEPGCAPTGTVNHENSTPTTEDIQEQAAELILGDREGDDELYGGRLTPPDSNRTASVISEIKDELDRNVGKPLSETIRDADYMGGER